MRILSFLGFATIALAISSCCQPVMCDCVGDAVDNIPLAFDNQSGNNFTTEEIDTIHVVRYDQRQTQPIDTVRLMDSAGVYYFSLGHSDNIAEKVVGSIDDHDFLITNPEGSFNYRITAIEIDGKTQSRCCSCYTNTKKLLKLNDQQVDASEVQPPHNYVTLRK